MASRSENGARARRHHLDIVKAVSPKRIDTNNFEPTDPKPELRYNYDEAEDVGCRWCNSTPSCSEKIPQRDSRKFGFRLQYYSNSPPVIKDRYGIPMKTIHRLLTTDTDPVTIPFRLVIPQCGLRHATAWIEARLRECSASHRMCEKISSVGPKRLLKLGTKHHVSVVDTPMQLPKFVALSYCWGGDQESKLTKNTIGAFRDKLPWDTLPVLHKDVIEICRGLGLEYLWIDALCIIQDDGDDWADQAAVMADIYENAYLTISATRCSNPRQNLLGRVDLRYGGKENLLRQVKDGMSLIGPRDSIEVGHHRSPSKMDTVNILDTRGWCFQESRLSRRMVSFTSQELQWQCRESRKCECGKPAVPDMSNILVYKEMKHITKFKAYKLWRNLLQRYTTTNLTRAQDRLVALAGLASRMAFLTGSTYLAGLWRDDLAANLLWKSKLRNRPFPTEYRAPTFSWASVDSPVLMIMRRESYATEQWTPTIVVIDAHVDLKANASPFGEVTGGFLRLKARISPAELQILESGEITIAIDGLGQLRRIFVVLDGKITRAEDVEGLPVTIRLRADDNLSYTFSSDSENLLAPFRVQVLQLGFLTVEPYASYYLILGHSPSNSNCYERLGLMRWRHRGGGREPLVEDFMKLPEQEVVIV